MIKSVHYLRGLAALLVVFFHFRYYLNDYYAHSRLGDLLFANGAFGVDLFFIISGFIICYATQRPEPKPLVSYALKRIFRIYPLLIVSLVVFYLLFGDNNTSVLRSLLPLHADYSQSGPFFGYNMLSPVWTLTYEIFFYGLFFIGLMLSQRYRKVLVLGLIMAVFVASQLAVNQELELSAYTQFDYTSNALLQPLIALVSSPMLLEFGYGIILYMVFQSLPEWSAPTQRRLLPWVILLAVLAAIALYLPSFYGHGPLKWGLAAWVLLFAALLYERIQGIPTLPVLHFLGDISFSLYLTHIIMIKVIRKYGWDFGLEGGAAFIWAVVASLVVATVLFYVVEKNAIVVCRKLLQRVNTASARQVVYA
ncbi:MAG TPA: acyltransferase [Paenalcaligenes hominis]|uniref:Acyltransferase n=1 Tax=Paenalcaligenes hominis TaxID=643674 RepID=A0A9D3AB37_9BURK|nr:acyltransferase [Paenalcaligenes hominis]NJB64104.1 peptidoglycan/LPS O-acetylase OafA/YrhL [Paenalcaligenes hominis]GGE63083.1 acyltransferase [Paenalcaligenes hominis]HJH24095.1 acyltransferase [Paenalcaligenes hominis]